MYNTGSQLFNHYDNDGGQEKIKMGRGNFESWKRIGNETITDLNLMTEDGVKCDKFPLVKHASPYHCGFIRE